VPASLQSPYAPLANPPTAARPLHVVLASTGSVASIKIPLIVEALLQHANVRVQLVATEHSLHFFDAAALGEQAGYGVQDLAQENRAAVRNLPPTARPRMHVWRDADEWSSWKSVGDPILHIEVSERRRGACCYRGLILAAAQLRRWADIVLVAPCSANTLAKITGGICDSLLVSRGPLPSQDDKASHSAPDILSARALAEHADGAVPGDEHADVHASTHGQAAGDCAPRARLRGRGADQQAARVRRPG
jgi:phosphopantothenoylcysteine decarboxylase